MTEHMQAASMPPWTQARATFSAWGGREVGGGRADRSVLCHVPIVGRRRTGRSSHGGPAPVRGRTLRVRLIRPL